MGIELLGQLKVIYHHGLVWFLWFDLGLRALNFNTVSQCPIWSISKVGIELLGQLKTMMVVRSSIFI